MGYIIQKVLTILCLADYPVYLVSHSKIRDLQWGEVCTTYCRHWPPVGLVVYKRRNQKSYPIEGAMKKLLELCWRLVWISSVIASAGKYILTSSTNLGRDCVSYFYSPVSHKKVLYAGCTRDAVDKSSNFLVKKLYLLSSVNSRVHFY